MKFKVPAMEIYFNSDFMQGDVRSLVVNFDHWSASRMLPEPLISDVQRSKKENTAVYLERYRYLRDCATRNDEGQDADFEALSGEDQHKALELQDKTDADLLREAQLRFSWHMVGCAVDFSGRPYGDKEFGLVRDYLQSQCPHPKWEPVRLHTVAGDRPHFHVGRRDFVHRVKIERAKSHV